MTQPFWLRNLDTPILNRAHNELPGATPESFANSMLNFEDFLGSRYEPHDFEEIKAEAGNKADENHSRAKRALHNLYEQMLGTPYYRTEKLAHPEGGFVFSSYFGNIAVGIPPRIAEADPKEFLAMLPSSSEYPREVIPLPRPLSRRIWIEGKSSSFEEDVVTDKFTIIREGDYSAQIKLENGLKLRVSVVEAFYEELKRCEDLRTLLDVWEGYRSLVLNRTVGIIGALQLFADRLRNGERADERAKRDLKGRIFDLAHLTGTVAFREVLRMPLRDAKDAIILDENDWSDIFRALRKAGGDIEASLLPFVHPKAHGGRYGPKAAGWRDYEPQDLTPSTIETALKNLMSGMVLYANVPHIGALHRLPAEGDEPSMLLHEIAEDNPDPTASDEPYAPTETDAAEWNPCSSLVAIDMVAATTPLLVGCVGMV